MKKPSLRTLMSKSVWLNKGEKRNVLILPKSGFENVKCMLKCFTLNAGLGFRNGLARVYLIPNVLVIVTNDFKFECSISIECFKFWDQILTMFL